MDQASQVKADPRRALPSMDRILETLFEKAPELPLWARKVAAQRTLGDARHRLGRPGAPPTGFGELARQALERARDLARPRPGRVVNATGVVLHTNLGRAPIAEGAARAALAAAVAYSDLELDLPEGRRGNRQAAVSDLLCLLSGAEAALVVNNNAAAVLLLIDTLARGRDVIVSRGELVEIGGSFRVPEILERSGARLAEVGTTNRTHLDDYARAIGPDSALLLKVHRSNFEQRGFVAEVGLEQLAALGRERGLPVVEDLGSGTLLDLRSRGLPAESHAPARLDLGADLVCFSGDKLLGGPQAGIILGRRELVAAARRNPLARALRLDKLDLAALDWTLRALLDGRAEHEIPVLRQLLEPLDALERRAERLAERLSGALAGRLDVQVEASRSPVGGGSVPGLALASHAVALRSAQGAERLATALRAGPVPVVGRVHKEALHLDVRTLLADDEDVIEQALLRCVGYASGRRSC
jgi:L-seryl-tRNA(Ser) seleniumtransferase